MGIPIRHREDVMNGLTGSRAGRYAYSMDQAFEPVYRQMISMELKTNLPQELLYVAMIESGFVETAESHASAVGVWRLSLHWAPL